MPTARDGTGRSAYYEATPMSDSKDFRKQQRTGSTDNQRAKYYRKLSKGAMNAVINRQGNLQIQGERISDDTFQPRGEKGRLQKHVKWDLANPVKRLNSIAQQVTQPLRVVANIANRANPYVLASELIAEDIRTSSFADGTLKGRTASEMGFQGPPAPKSKLQPAPTKLSIQAPPPKDQAVLAKKGGATGSIINGLFIPHDWSFQQRMRYSARSGK